MLSATVKSIAGGDEWRRHQLGSYKLGNSLARVLLGIPAPVTANAGWA